MEKVQRNSINHEQNEVAYRRNGQVLLFFDILQSNLCFTRMGKIWTY